MTKYGNLVKRMSFKEGMGGAPALLKVYLGAGDLEGLEVNFVVGVYDILGEWVPKRGYKDTTDWSPTRKVSGAHAHSFEELLFFFGYDTNGLKELGAELEMCLGKEWEQHVISEPSVVVLPKDLPHCPLTTLKADRLYGHMHLALSTGHSAVGVEQDGDREGRKYANLIKKLPLEKGLPGAAHGFSMSGKDLEGLHVNLSIGLYEKEGLLNSNVSQVSPYDKLLLFFGNNSNDPNTLGAEVTLELGQEREKHTFTKSTAVVIPKGTPHMPLVAASVKKPFYAVQFEFTDR